ncbi:MAG TPA: alkaline phosphatase [Candidatus Limnocylindria bacterium]|nr:alkaline phosphatase [Candidatus Limnocylindria bacterium]
MFKAYLATLLALVSGAALGFKAQAETSPKHILVIGCDGMGSIAFTASNAPTMHRLMREGAYTLRARGVMPTSSSPNWASMIMGSGPEQHGVTSNEWETNRFQFSALETGPEGLFPTIFRVVREQKPSSSIYCVHDWDGFGRLVEKRAANLVTNVLGSTNTAAYAARVIEEKKPTFLFVHFDMVDHAGHGHGWVTPEYFDAVEGADKLIAQLIASLEKAGIAKDTLVLITADHGGVGTKHGGLTMEELEIPWIVWGAGVVRGHVIKSPVNTFDTAASLAYVLKLTPPSVWIGKPVKEAFTLR